MRPHSISLGLGGKQAGLFDGLRATLWSTRYKRGKKEHCSYS